jgi:Bacterial toxin 3
LGPSVAHDVALADAAPHDWHFVLGQLARAGVAVPDAALRYQRQDPPAERQDGARIAASPDVRFSRSLPCKANTRCGREALKRTCCRLSKSSA